MICRLISIWETLTFPSFWRSLLYTPLVTVDGHLYDTDPRYQLIGDREYETLRCVRCNQWVEQGWRQSWRVA